MAVEQEQVEQVGGFMKLKVQSFFKIISIIFCVATCTITQASETRGLQVVVKEASTGESKEVNLYNKNYAVIIGIDRYQNLSADRQLKNAVNDAKGVQEVLSRRYQFDRIVTLYDEQATKDRIMEVLTEELPAQMGKDDALFVFWAGHGNQEKSDYGDLGYLIPFDGTTDKIRKNLTMAELRDTISKKLPAKHVFYVMDACYSGLLTTRSVDNKTKRDLSYLRQITKESVRQVLTAGGKDEEAMDGGPKGHSVFTGRFIELLENAEDFITANELQAAIKERVYSDAKARNHTQTPGFGPLYGLGDYVFVPKLIDKLGNIAGISASRQKELDLLKIAETEAAVAKQKEQAEIAKKQAELDSLDKQIADMKGRLGTSSVRSDDSLDQIIILADQKEQQGQRLEELRKQREAEERKRIQEIEVLKAEAQNKLQVQIESDITKYEKIAANKYAQDLKATAWKALVKNYPEAYEIEQGDVKRLRTVLGVNNVQNDIVSLKTNIIKYPDDIWSYEKLGNIYKWAGKDTEAVEAYRQAAQRNSTNSDMYINLGILHEKKYQIDEAVIAYKQAVKVNPASAEAHLRLGDIHISRGLFQEAVEHYYAFLKLRPESPDIHLKLARIFVKSKEAGLALSSYNSVLTYSPNDGDANREIAALYAQKGDNEKAIAHYKKALAVHKGDAEARTTLISIYVKSKQYEEITVLLKEAVELNPDDPVNHYKLGLIYDFKKEYDNAIAMYKKAIELKPDARALNALGRLYMNTGRLREAKVTLEAAKKADPSMEEPTVLLNNIRDEYTLESSKKMKGSKKK